MEQEALFDEVALATTELQDAKAEFSRLHADIVEQPNPADALAAIELAAHAYTRWRNAAFRLRDLRQ